jgi:GH15 family glucan-1,4-alpha-glucosidase
VHARRGSGYRKDSAVLSPAPPNVRIADYALLSNCTTAALVHRAGSVDWYCPTRFDAPAVFARLLDAQAGYWSIQPAIPFTSRWRYLPDTMVVEITFETAQGVVSLTDALALEDEARDVQIGIRSPHILLRQVRGLRGQVPLRIEYVPRPEYGIAAPLLHWHDDGLVTTAGSLELILTTDANLHVSPGKAVGEHTLLAGDTLDFALHDRIHRDEQAASPRVDVGAALHNAAAGWQSWANDHMHYEGLYAEPVRRSAMVLHALTYMPTGAIIAAPTTSLPEIIGGSANWDYRFVWLRDLTLAMRALWIAACPDEAVRFFSWLNRAIGDLDMDHPTVQIVYGIEGERDLTEHMLTHLAGYRDSRPVRVGNDAWFQRQLDVLGEVIDAVYLFREQLGPLSPALARMVCQLANRAAATWHEPDAGMWEARDQERHYLTAKVMCWVALDRAIRLADQLGDNADREMWARERDAIREAVLNEGWNEAVGAYTGAFGSDHLDASVLLLPLVGFLPATDARMASTIRTIERELSHQGQVFRWKGEPNAFVLCTCWLVECLALLGETDRATALFEATTAQANDLGLLAEMSDPHTGELIGNFPQAFSHIGLINAAWRLNEIRTRQTMTETDFA